MPIALASAARETSLGPLLDTDYRICFIKNAQSLKSARLLKGVPWFGIH